MALSSIKIYILAFCAGLLTVKTAFSQTTDLLKPKDSAVAKPVDSNFIQVGNINITGYKKTKPYIIGREMQFKTGDVLSLSQLQAKILVSKQFIFNTGLFLEVEIYPTSQTDSVLNLEVLVKERWYILPLPVFEIADRNFSTWLNDSKASLSRVNIGVRTFVNNFTGRNDFLAVGVVGGYSREFSLSYSLPYFDKKLQQGLSFFIGYNSYKEVQFASSFNKQSFYRNQDEFVSNSLRLAVGYSYRPRINWRHSFSLGYSNVIVDDSVVLKNPNYFGLGAKRQLQFGDFRYILSYFNADYGAYPLEGFSGSISFFKRGFSSELNSWNFDLNTFYTQKLFHKTYGQVQFLGSIKLPFDQPFFNQRNMGYGNLFLRGLETYVIDGVAGAITKFTLVRELFKFNWRFPIRNKFVDVIPFRFFLKAYADFGYAYSKQPGNSRLSNKSLYSGGIGLDILSFYDFVLRIEYSFNQLGQNGIFLQQSDGFTR
jgi:outer membrane protein assembly factor BamA